MNNRNMTPQDIFKAVKNIRLFKNSGNGIIALNNYQVSNQLIQMGIRVPSKSSSLEVRLKYLGIKNINQIPADEIEFRQWVEDRGHDYTSEVSNINNIRSFDLITSMGPEGTRCENMAIKNNSNISNNNIIKEAPNTHEKYVTPRELWGAIDALKKNGLSINQDNIAASSGIRAKFFGTRNHIRKLTLLLQMSPLHGKFLNSEAEFIKGISQAGFCYDDKIYYDLIEIYQDTISYNGQFKYKIDRDSSQRKPSENHREKIVGPALGSYNNSNYNMASHSSLFKNPVNSQNKKSRGLVIGQHEVNKLLANEHQSISNNQPQINNQSPSNFSTTCTATQNLNSISQLNNLSNLINLSFVSQSQINYPQNSNSNSTSTIAFSPTEEEEKLLAEILNETDTSFSGGHEDLRFYSNDESKEDASSKVPQVKKRKL